MENPAERQSMYQELLGESFEQLIKQLPKANKPLVQQFLDQLKSDQDLNANRYFGVYKLAIGLKDPKLILISLDSINKLINTGFLDGNCDESTIALDLDKSKESEKSPKDQRESKRKLIDTIVETVCLCKREKNDDIHLQLINVLTIIATKLKNIVHGTNLQKIIESLTAVYAVSRHQANQNSAKTSLKLIVSTVFQRVDKGDGGQANDVSRLQRSRDKKNDFEGSFVEGPSKILSNRLSPDVTTRAVAINEREPEEILAKYNEKDKQDLKREDSKEMETVKPESLKNEDLDTSKQKDSHYKNYVTRCVTNLVDDVCIYYAKIDHTTAKYEGKDESERENMQKEIHDIPIKAVPIGNDADDPRYKSFKKVKVDNESGTPAGVFGWCFVCRQPASLFCKDTKVPLCTLECKFSHLEEASNLPQKLIVITVIDFLSNSTKSESYSRKSLDEIQDAYQVFGYLCRLSGKDQGKDNLQEVIKVKSLALELLLATMSHPSTIFSSRKEFRDSIREYLCASVFKNSVSTDKNIFSYSLGIFDSLVNRFRDFLKPEMVLFVDRIFLNMLESGNSNYHHRLSALQVFQKICSRANVILDFYVNYDCDIESTNLVQKIVELLCKIAQGKYSRPEYSSVVQPAQDQNLRLTALSALVNLVKVLVVFTEDCNRRTYIQNPLKKATQEEDTKDDDEKESVLLEAEDIKATMFDKLDEIGKARNLKNELQKAIQKFNFKIKNGMKMFTQLGVLKPDDAKSVAKFFKKTPNLSKEKLGEYFGDEHEFNIKVMTEYTELIDFRGRTLDDGLRVYLDYFVLPGEGQKIDRVMQVFAGKYFQDNPKSFNSATAAYTLSFLFMMLQTDAHNANIKPEEKMKLNQFINLARGINDGQDLAPEVLTGFYNRIITSPLALHEADRAKKLVADSQGTNVKKKEEEFIRQSSEMIREGQKLIKNAQAGYYHTVRTTECIKPLFHEVVWSPVLAVFSVLLEQSDDPNMVQSCLEGFANCIILTGLHNMSVERDTFVSSLAKFTNILTIREIKEKNVKCIRLLLDLASNRGNLLRSSWRYVLECIVWIDHYFHYSPMTSKLADMPGVKSGRGVSSEALEQIEQINSEKIQQGVDLHVVNIIFSKSANFDMDEIIDFITCLCQISEEELKGKGTNTYCLQKLVEVAHFNMDGIKFIWSKIWNIMREHISSVAINSKPEVSLFAIDSLKQLSIKFLSKKELGLLEFQREFLRPFETIFQKTKNDDMKELILSCCNYIISHTKKELKSGWKTIIDILGLTADAEDSHLSKIAFSITEYILQEDVRFLQEFIGEFTILLLKFSKSKRPEIAEASLRHLKSFLQKLITPDSASTLSRADTIKEDIDPSTPTLLDDQRSPQIVIIHGLPENTWISMLTSIITLASDSSAKIQTQSTMLLFDLLDQYGAGFPSNFWAMILSGVIKPLFDEIQYSFPSGSSRNAEKAAAFKEFYGKAFERFIDIYSVFFDKLSQYYGELFNIVLNCIQNPNQVIGKVGINALKYMILKDENLRQKGIDLIFDLYTRLCATTPLANALGLVSSPNGGESTETEETGEKEIQELEVKREMGIIEYKGLRLHISDCEVQCRTQILLVGLIKDSVDRFFEVFEEQQVSRVKDMLRTVWYLARRFNEQIYLRYNFGKLGFMRDREDKSEIPDLIEQEREALSALSTVLFRLYTESKDQAEKERNLNEFLDMGTYLITVFKGRNEKLIALIKNESRKAGDSETPIERQGRFTFEETHTDEEFKKQAGKIRKAALEKEILGLRSLLYNEFLAKLAKINPEEMRPRVRGLSKSLIEGVVCFVPKESEEQSEVLRNILSRYFEFSHEKSEE